jgi:hypothetical protein
VPRPNLTHSPIPVPTLARANAGQTWPSGVLLGETSACPQNLPRNRWFVLESCRRTATASSGAAEGAPLGPPQSRRLLALRIAVFGHVTDTPVSTPEREAPVASFLFFDGIFLHRPELYPYWDASIFVQVDFAVSVSRCASRDGAPADPLSPVNRRYVEGQRLDIFASEPAKRAKITLDNNDLARPTFVKT